MTRKILGLCDSILGFSCLSIGLLKTGFIRSGNADLTPDDDDELEAYLWPIVREMVKRR